MFLFLAHLFLSQSLKPISREIKDYHSKKIAFQSFSPFSIDTSGKSLTYQKAAKDLIVLKLERSELSKIVSERPEAMAFTFPFENRELIVEMIKVDIYSPGFHIETNKRKVLDYKKGVFYRGIIKGDDKSVVAFSFFDNDIVGIASDPRIGNITLGKAKQSEDFVVYNDQKLTGTNPFICATDELVNNEKQKISFDPNNSKVADVTNSCVRIYYEICYNAFLQNGSSVTNTINWISAVQNNVNTLYANDGVKMSLKSLYIWETPDPYIGQSNDYLTAFNNYRPYFDGDLAHLINTPSTTSYAYLDSLCENYRYAYSGVNIAYADVPTYSWSTNVMAHEMGHSLGSPHTHACAWNGDMTPIDGCGPTAGYTETGCGTVGPLPTKGTIMSYCHLVQSVGINLALGFGEQPAALIRQTVDSKSCLGNDCTSACNSTITFFSIDNILKNSLTVKFTDVSSSQWKYRVTLMDGTIVQSDITTENNFTIANLLPGTFYKVELGMNCSSTYQFSQIILTDDDWCGKTITDSGGTTANYSDGEYWYKTIYPENENQKMKITFQSINLVPNNDFLVIRNGPSLDSPIIPGASRITGTYLRGPFQSTHPTGAITLVFKSDSADNDAGFQALLTCSTLGVNDVSESSDVLLSPNPVKHNFTLSGMKNILKVEIYDASGKHIKQFDDDSLLKNYFDVSRLKAGIYFVKIKTESKTVNKKLIKE